MNLQILLEQLADGAFHSGSAIGASLGVSRTAVWKSLTQLNDLGLECESVKGKGYRLPYPIELLSAEKIQSNLSQDIKTQIELDVLLTTESTNAYLTNVVLGRPYHVCLAEHQSSGRGRRGRSWVSPFGRNIYMSLAFDLNGGVEALSGLSLVVGIAVVRALRAKGLSDAKLKWPNDVWVNDRKVCGILVELQGEATTSWRVVVGLGLNVSMSSDDQSAGDIDQAWTSVSDHIDVGRNDLAAELLVHLLSVLGQFQSVGFGGFAGEWAEMDALKGRNLAVNNGELSGVSEGVDLHGGLLLRLSDGELRSINAGEVSVRCR